MSGVEAMRFSTVRAVSALLLIALVLAACSGAEDAAQSSGGGSPADQEANQASGQGAESARSGGGQLAPSSAVGSESQVLPEDFDRKIVKIAELGIRAEAVRESTAHAQQIAGRFGGSVLSSQINQGDDSIYADLVLSIPSPEFEDALDELRSLGKEVTTDSVSGEDVTEEFVDLQSRERNLLAAEQSLLELYDRAQSVNEALSIERELTNIRGQVEQVQGRIKYLEQRTALSQITLSIHPVPSPKPSQPTWDPARVVVQAWNASLLVLQTLATAVLSVVAFGWWLAPALVAGLVWWRRRNRGSNPAATDT
jgi:hypothetical protein